MSNPSVFPLRSLRLSGSTAFRIAFSANHSLTSASTAPQYARGGIDWAIRCICVISATSAELPASQLRQFSALLPDSRQSFQRMYCDRRESFRAQIAFSAFRMKLIANC